MTAMTVFWRGAMAVASLTIAMPATAAGRIVVGQPAPDTDMTLLDDSKVTLSSLRGQVVVLNFWATWCVPCRVELRNRPLVNGNLALVEDAALPPQHDC